MRRLKRYGLSVGIVFAFVLAVCIRKDWSMQAWAAPKAQADSQTERIYDLAGLFSSEEREALSAEAQALAERMQMDVAVVTTDAHEGSAQEYAEEFYISANLGTGSSYDGVLFLIDMDERELWITPAGKMTRYLTDSRIEAVLDDAYSYIADGLYYETAQAFLADTRSCYENGIAGDQYNEDIETGKRSRYHSLAWYELLFALAAAAACGLFAVRSVVREYGMKDEASRMAANFRLSYRKDSAFKPGVSVADVLLGSYVTHTVIAAARNAGRSGGSGGAGGGFSGGGRSSTHTSGGRTFGGGGRKF